MGVFLIKIRLHRCQIFVGELKQMLGDGQVDGHRHNAGIRHAVVELHGDERSRAGRVGPRHHQNGLGAALAGKQSLVAQASIAVEYLAALGVHGFRRVAQHQRHLVRQVEVGEGIVAFAEAARHGKPVASEDHFALHLAVGAERKRTKVGFVLEGPLTDH